MTRRNVPVTYLDVTYSSEAEALQIVCDSVSMIRVIFLSSSIKPQECLSLNSVDHRISFRPSKQGHSAKLRNRARAAGFGHRIVEVQMTLAFIAIARALPHAKG